MTRVATALILLPLFLALVWMPPLRAVFVGLVVIFVWQGLREYCGLLRVRGIEIEYPALAFAGALVTLSGCSGQPDVMACIMTVAVMTVASIEVLRGRLSVSGIAAAAFGVVYLGWFGGHMVLLLDTPVTGPGLTTFLIVAVAITDTGAYLSGSRFGRHKMAPRVSPNKSWEGSVGGLLFAVGAACAFASLQANYGWSALPAWRPWQYVVAGVVLSLAGQMGDLVESALKRDAGVKDSGTLFPGHGGVMDRCDSFLFAAPVLYYWSGMTT